MNRENNIYLIEGNSFIREGIRTLLEINISVSNIEIIKLEDLNNKDKIDQCELFVFGIENLSIEKIQSSLQQLKGLCPDARILLIANKLDMCLVKSCFSMGADGLILNNISTKGFLHSLDLILTGEKVFPSALASYFLEDDSNINDTAVQNLADEILSDREYDIIRGLERGESNKVIAQQLGITEATVKVHVKAVLRKLNLKNRTQAAIWAMNNGLNPALKSR